MEIMSFEPVKQEYIFKDAEDCKGQINGISPALKYIPDHLKDEYLDDQLKTTSLQWFEDGRVKLA